MAAAMQAAAPEAKALGLMLQSPLRGLKGSLPSLRFGLGRDKLCPYRNAPEWCGYSDDSSRRGRTR